MLSTLLRLLRSRVFQRDHAVEHEFARHAVLVQSKKTINRFENIRPFRFQLAAVTDHLGNI
jgi:hypothetical protein